MLTHPYAYINELNKVFADKVFSNVEKYQYYFTTGYLAFPEIYMNDYSAIQRLSIHNDEVIGWMVARLDREQWMVAGLEVISFKDKPSFLFGKDGVKFFNDLVDVYQFTQISWEFCYDIPVRKMYERIVEQYDGSIIDLLEPTRLQTGKSSKMMRAVIKR